MMDKNENFRKFSSYLKERFGGKVWKIPVDAGFSCPNRDGVKGHGGCIYCNVDSFDGSEAGTIKEQVVSRAEKLRKRGISRFIIYFQSYSNTYAPLDVIRERVEASLSTDGIVAVHIGTRPDVIDSEKLAYFKELNEKYEVVIEYGLQSANDATLENINRGHSVQDFIDAVELTHSFGIKTCAHIIFGLPGDSREDMLDSVRLVNSLGVHSVKFHHLHVVLGTRLEQMYMNKEVILQTEDEYLDVLSEAIGLLSPDMVIARLVGDCPADTLVAPDWPANKGVFEQKLNDLLIKKGISQGSLL